MKQQTGKIIAVSCVMFKAGKYIIYGQNQNKGITSQEMEDLFTKTVIQPTENKGGFVFKNDREFQVIAQQTTGGDVRQLHFEVTLVLIYN